MIEVTIQFKCGILSNNSANLFSKINYSLSSIKVVLLGLNYGCINQWLPLNSVFLSFASLLIFKQFHWVTFLVNKNWCAFKYFALLHRQDYYTLYPIKSWNRYNVYPVNNFMEFCRLTITKFHQIIFFLNVRLSRGLV